MNDVFESRQPRAIGAGVGPGHVKVLHHAPRGAMRRVQPALALMVFLGATLAAVGSWAANDPSDSGAAAAAAGATAAAPEASIPFANHGGIYNWQVVDDKTVLIEGRDLKTWYKATLMSPCFNLPFAERLGFDSNPDGSFDKFSAILLRDQRCPLVSLVKTSPPKKKSAQQKPAGAAPSAQ